ncbi:PIG-L family deacetylase [bacterium]|nr:PIG-L family deacetylase [bacterium]
MRSKLLLVFLLFVALTVPTSARVKSSIPDAARLQLLMKKLTVVGSALYVGAHPDDENTAVLAHLSLGRLLRTGYLALNRGEGGQNLIGNEQGDLLGVIRTQELLAARQIDQAEQYFTRAIDFGFSKSAEESLSLWGKEDVLSDAVWVFRVFRPDVVITRFPSEGETHGHHVASGILAEEAFHAAGDPNRFQGQLKYVSVWQPKRIVWNRYSWGNQPIPDEEKAKLAELEIGEYNPLLGKSYTEIAGISRSMHKSQGFGDSEDRGRFTQYFRHTAGEPATKDLFSSVDLTWNRIAGGQEIGKVLEQAVSKFHPKKPEQSIPDLLKAYRLMRKIQKNPLVEQKISDLLEVIRGCSGLWLEAISSQDAAAPGADVAIDLTAINRSSFSLQLESVQVLPSNNVETIAAELKYNEPVTKKLTIHIPAEERESQPYWLRGQNGKPLSDVKEQRLIGSAESPAAFSAQFILTSGQDRLVYTEPVLFRKVDPVKGEVYKDFVVVPEAALNIQNPLLVFADESPKSVRVQVISGGYNITGELKLLTPEGWIVQPASQAFNLTTRDQAKVIPFTIQPQNGARTGEFKAEATVGAHKISNGKLVIDYPHIPAQNLFPVSRGRLIRVDLKKTGQIIGYIVGSGDAIPEALTQVGYKVTRLTDEDLVTQNLSSYDAILVGIRAYNTRPALKDLQEKLMDYVQQGGTLIVQYQTLLDSNSSKPGPYPFQISRKRVSVETAPVTILKPDHSLLNFPNKITQADFEGWIQERGLYFADQWDPKYETIFSSNDPKEQPLEGGTLYARYGKGVYIFTAYSWFRELPAGVPGAYRIFVNMISARKK